MFGFPKIDKLARDTMLAAVDSLGVHLADVVDRIKAGIAEPLTDDSRQALVRDCACLAAITSQLPLLAIAVKDIPPAVKPGAHLRVVGSGDGPEAA